MSLFLLLASFQIIFILEWLERWFTYYNVAYLLPIVQNEVISCRTLVCVCVSFSLFLSFLISILYVNVKKTCLWHFSGQGMYYNIWSFVFMLDFKGLTSWSRNLRQKITPSFLKQYSVLLNSLQHLLFSWVLLICQRLQAGNQKLMFLLLKDNLVNHNLCYS